MKMNADMKNTSFDLRFCLRLSLLTLLLWGVSTVPVWSAACRVAKTSLSFGVYDMLSPVPTDATEQLSVRCTHKVTAPATVQVTLSGGSSGSVAQRSMSAPTAVTPLNYNLYSDAGMSSILGDGTGGSVTLTSIVDKTAPWTINVFGRIDALQVVPLGSFSDTLTATILY